MTGSWATAIGLRMTPTYITLRALIFTSPTTVRPTRYQMICTPRRLHTHVRSEVTKPTFSSIARGGGPNLGTVCLGFRRQKKPSRPVHNESPRFPLPEGLAELAKTSLRSRSQSSFTICSPRGCQNGSQSSSSRGHL